MTPDNSHNRGLVGRLRDAIAMLPHTDEELASALRIAPEEVTLLRRGKDGDGYQLPSIGLQERVGLALSEAAERTPVPQAARDLAADLLESLYLTVGTLLDGDLARAREAGADAAELQRVCERFLVQCYGPDIVESGQLAEQARAYVRDFLHPRLRE